MHAVHDGMCRSLPLMRNVLSPVNKLACVRLDTVGGDCGRICSSAGTPTSVALAAYRDLEAYDY